MRYLILLLLIFSIGCSDPKVFQGPPGSKGDPGAGGSNGADGATGPQGAAGNTGATGPAGANGSQGYGAGIKLSAISPGGTCLAGGTEIETFQDLNNSGFEDAGEPLVGLAYICNGANGTNGTNGTNGSNGANGTNGANGSNGVSATFSVIADSGAHCSNGGFDVTLTDYLHSTTEYVCNGVNGTNGSNGQAGTNGTNGANGGTVSFSLVQAILPCGANSSPWKEVILGLQGGQLLSSFSETASGQNTRFAFIPNGGYNDTDSSGCNFSVSGDGSTWSQINWNAGANGYSAWPAGGFHWTQPLGWVAL